VTADQIGTLFNYGVVGVMVILFLTDRLFTKGRVDREMQLTDRATATNDKLVTALDRQTTALDMYRQTVEKR
jgi:hypothetical protein